MRAPAYRTARATGTQGHIWIALLVVCALVTFAHMLSYMTIDDIGGAPMRVRQLPNGNAATDDLGGFGARRGDTHGPVFGGADRWGSHEPGFVYPVRKSGSSSAGRSAAAGDRSPDRLSSSHALRGNTNLANNQQNNNQGNDNNKNENNNNDNDPKSKPSPAAAPGGSSSRSSGSSGASIVPASSGSSKSAAASAVAISAVETRERALGAPPPREFAPQCAAAEAKALGAYGELGKMLTLRLRTAVAAGGSGSGPADAGDGLVDVETTETVAASRLAIFGIDPWNHHWCKEAEARLQTLYDTKMARFTLAARSVGARILYMPHHATAPYHKMAVFQRARAANRAKFPLPRGRLKLPKHPFECNDCCNDRSVKPRTHKVWTAINPSLPICAQDVVSVEPRDVYVCFFSFSFSFFFFLFFCIYIYLWLHL
jgi:hypothetical protein